MPAARALPIDLIRSLQAEGQTLLNSQKPTPCVHSYFPKTRMLQPLNLGQKSHEVLR